MMICLRENAYPIEQKCSWAAGRTDKEKEFSINFFVERRRRVSKKKAFL